MRGIAGHVVRSNMLRATILWLIATTLAVSVWSVFVVGTERDPTNYVYARSYLEGQTHGGLMSRAVAGQLLAELRWQLFHWIVAEARLPVLFSLFAIPLLAWLIARAGDERWVVTWLAIGLAVIIPIIASAPSPVREIRSASSAANVVRSGGTPVPTPMLDAGSH